MAKEKGKNYDGKIVVGDGTNKIMRKETQILDTSPSPMLLDLNSIDEGKTIEGILNLNDTRDTRDNMTISFRINKDDLEWAKRLARDLSIKGDKDINYQKLIMSVFLEKFPRPENFDKEKK